MSRKTEFAKQSQATAVSNLAQDVLGINFFFQESRLTLNNTGTCRVVPGFCLHADAGINKTIRNPESIFLIIKQLDYENTNIFIRLL